MRLLCALFLVSVLAYGCAPVNRWIGLKDDNIVETLSEDVIRYKTGLDIDLTPENPDEDDYSFDIWRKN